MMLIISISVFAPPFFDNSDRIRAYECSVREQTVKKIIEAIKTIESNGNYSAVGQSGEYGAYQYTYDTWKMACLRYTGYILDISVPENQDYVTMLRIKYFYDSGYSIDQIASLWNSNSSSYENKVGVNKYGVEYNTPNYVDKFLLAYNN